MRIWLTWLPRYSLTANTVISVGDTCTSLLMKMSVGANERTPLLPVNWNVSWLKTFSGKSFIRYKEKLLPSSNKTVFSINRGSTS